MKTKSWLKKLIVVGLAMQTGAVWAGEGPLRLSIGASYRDFDDIEVSGGRFRNSGTANNPTGPYGVQNVTSLTGNPINAPVILDYASAGSGSSGVGSSDKWAPIIGLEYDLTPACDLFGLSVVGNFQYFQVGAASSMSGSAGAPGGIAVKQYQHWWLDTNLDLVGDTVSPGLPLVGSSLPGTTFSMRTDFDMDLYVLDVGLQLRLKEGPARFTLALGPSVTIADAESSMKEQAAWRAQGPGLPAGSYTKQTSDSNLDFLLGAYAALGASLDISKSWSIGVECRYDYVDDNAGTDQVDMDLSSLSGIVRVAYQF